MASLGDGTKENRDSATHARRCRRHSSRSPYHETPPVELAGATQDPPAPFQWPPQ
jgi:hypothetical protein